MAASFIWKPSTINSWKQGIAFLAPSESSGSAPTVTTASGQTYTGKYINDNEGRKQWIFPSSLAGESDLSVNYGGVSTKIGQGSTSYEGNDLASWVEREKGSLGSSGGGGSYPGFAQPGTYGQYGVYPGYLGDMFPSPFSINYAPIKGADFKYIDPIKYATEHAQEIQDLYKKNFDFSQDLALKELNLDLKGLESFAPAATALKQSLTSADNIFNQAQRTAQLRNTLPGVLGNLEQQTKDASIYASGRVPDSINDRALELGIRSRAADQTLSSGFGGPAARKVSDLMSAEERLKIAQYGNNLVGQNAQQRAALELAPTEYSDAGSQLRVTPPVNPSQLSAQARGELNSLTQIPATVGLNSSVQQGQFKAGLQQQTQQFNASNQLATDQFNANNENSFALQKFGYQVSYAGAVAGAAQTDLNTNAAIEQQKKNQEIFQDYMNKAQEAGQWGAIAQGLGSLLGGAGGISGIIGGLMSGISGGNTSGNSFIGLDPVANTPSATPEIPGLDLGVSPDINEPSGPVTVPEFDAGATGGSEGPSSGASLNGPSSEPSVPDFSYDPGPSAQESFTQDTGMNLESLSPRTLRASSAGVMDAAGLHTQPFQGTSFVGYSPTARPIFSNTALASSQNPSMGGQYVEAFQGIVSPLGALTKEDQAGLSTIAASASNPGNISALDRAVSNGDAKGFVTTASKVAGTSEKVGKDAYAAYQMYQNWDKMSGAQKAIGLAALGIHGYKYAGGKDLGQIPLVKGANGKTELSLGQGLQLFAAGYNTYSLVKNWNQLNPIQKIAVGTQDAFQMAKLAKQFGLLGTGTTGASVAVSAAQLAASGWKTAPQYGIGAVAGTSASKIPDGYTVISQTKDGGTIAVPKANAGSTVGGAASFGAGALNVYSKWGQGGVKGALNGAIGGSAMAAGLSQMGQTNPYLAAGVIALSVAGDTWGKGGGEVSEEAQLAASGASAYAGAGTTAGAVAGGAAAAVDIYSARDRIKNAPEGEKGKTAVLEGYRAAGDYYTGGAASPVINYTGRKAPEVTNAAEKAILYGTAPGWAGLAYDKFSSTFGGGKSGAQKDRDQIRNRFQTAGLLDDKHGLVLADGTVANLGIDGRGNLHESRNPDMIKVGNRKLFSYETDYSNDMDYAAGMAGSALSRLLNGGKGKAISQLGGQLGNAFLGKVGYGKDMTQGNFDITMANARAAFAKSGITNKADLYQLVNQGYAEGRWDESDAIAMHQAANMMYDKNGFETANTLLAGRFRGLEVARETAPAKTTLNVPNNSFNFGGASNLMYRPPAGTKIPADAFMKGFGVNAPASRGGLTKEEYKQKNAARYNVAPYQQRA